MACRVKYDKNNNVVEVYAANGNVSKLWTDLTQMMLKKDPSETDKDLSNKELWNEIKKLKIIKHIFDIDYSTSEAKLEKTAKTIAKMVNDKNNPYNESYLPTVLPKNILPFLRDVKMTSVSDLVKLQTQIILTYQDKGIELPRVKEGDQIGYPDMRQAHIQYKIWEVTGDLGKRTPIDALQEAKNKAYKHYLSLRTNEFKEWFGDWENDPNNASKVVDENGEPLIVFHSTREKFDVFDKEKMGATDAGFAGKGFYFSPNRVYSKGYGPVTIPVFLNIKNPAIIDPNNEEIIDVAYKGQKASKRFPNNDGVQVRVGDWAKFVASGIHVSKMQELKEIGLANENNELVDIVAFNPNQIKSAINNIGNYSKEDDNIYWQIEPSTQHKMDEKLNKKVKRMLDQLGIPYEAVATLKDRNGQPMRGVAKADMLLKVVQVVEGKADISTLPEEAAHFFVEVIKKANPELYDQMFNKITEFTVYDRVKDEYSKLDSYANNENKLKDEAIGKLIAKEMVDQHLEDERIENLPWLKRWMAKMMRSIKQAFGQIFGDPYKTAAYQMLHTDLSKYKKAVKDINSPESYLQADSASEIEMKSSQNELVDNILDTHKKLRIDSDILKSELGKSDYKILKTLLDQDDEGTFSRYILEGPDGETTMITNRSTDEGTRQFIRKIGKLRAKEINRSERAAHARKHGTKFHGATQNMVETLASKRSNEFDVVQTLDIPGSKSLKEIQTQSGLNNKLFKNFKNGIEDVLDTISETQNKISTEGKAKILTEVRIYDPHHGRKGKVGTGTAGTIDLLVIYSDGTIGIFDWKFMTPQWQYTLGFDEQKTLIDDPWTIKMDGWNTQIGTYKEMLLNVHGIENKDIRQSRIIPAHVEYKTKDPKNEDYTKTDDVNVFQMSSRQNPFLEQIAVGRELSNFGDLNKLLKKLYDKRDRLAFQLKNAQGRREAYSVIKARYLKTLKLIQEATVKEEILNLIHANNDHIVRIQENIHKNDPSEEGYLHYEDLLGILEDLMMFDTLNTDTADYVKNLKNDPDPDVKKTGEKIEKFLGKGLLEIQSNIKVVENKMYERLMDEASTQGENLKESPLKLGFWAKNLTQMDEMDHPVFRVAMTEITKSFNKQKQVTDAIWADIQAKQEALRTWGEKNGMSLTDVFKNKLVKDTIVKDPKTGEETIVSRNLVPKFSSKLYQEIEKRREAGDVDWFKKHFKLKDNAREIYNQRKRNKKVEIEGMNEKQAEFSFKNFERFNNFWIADNNDVWLSPHSRLSYLELKNPEEFYSEEYNEMLLPGNEPLLNFYDMYRGYNKQFQKVTGKKQLKPGFIANRKDGIIETVINNGFNMNQFFDSVSRPFLTHAEEQTMGVRDEETGLVEQIPIPFLESITDSKGNIDHGLKSLDLGKSLYALSLGVYNYKYMSEIEAKVNALKHFLINEGTETDTNRWGNIKRDESGTAKETKTSEGTIETFDSFVKYYIYGQKLQDKKNVIAGIDVLKVVPALQSIYSLKVLAFAIVPGIAARTVGALNMYFEGIDGVNYNKKQMSQAHREYARNHKAVVTFSEFMDPFQSGLSWSKMRDLSMKKAAKYFNLDNAYYPLRAADENMDTLIAVAMAQNHGIDKDGNLQRMEDLLMKDENARSIWDLYLESFNKEDGSFNIPGLTDAAYVDFRRRIKEVAGKIKGEMSDENIVAAQTHLMGRLLLQFKSWMPGLVSERFKGIKYNRILKSLEEGRYIGFIKGASWGREMVENDRKFHVILGHTLKRGLEAVQHLLFLKKFITNPAERARLQKEGKWTDKMEADYKRRTDALTREFENWRRNTPGAANISSPNEFLKMRQRSVKRTLAEIRAIILIYLALSAMGIGGDDDEFRNQNFFSRKLNMILNRVAMELGFTLNPLELTKFLRGGIPLTGLFVDAINVVTNSFDETGAILGIWSNSYDRSPPLYYSSQWIPGAHQLGRFFEIWEPTSK